MSILAIYLRLSIEDDGDKDESNSITNQRRMIKDYIRSNSELGDYQVKEYCDDGYSGTNFDRPDIKILLEEVKAGRIGCLIVKDMSRFARDYIELGTYMNQIFPFMGVRFIAINDHYDSAAHRGNTVEIDTAFKTLLYDLYSKDISEKLKTSFRNKLDRGEYVFGQAPFGYEKDPDRKNVVRIKEEEAVVVRHIFQLSVAGKTTVEIAKILREKGVPTIAQMRKPNKVRTDRVTTWTDNAIRKLLSNRFYLGEFFYGKSVREVGSKQCTRLPENEWLAIKDHHEPLVTDEDFNNVTINRITAKRMKQKSKNPLVGKLICGGCRYPMIFKPEYNTNRYKRFECRMHAKLQIEDCCTYFNGIVLEELVLKMLNQELLKMGNLDLEKNHLLEVQRVVISHLKEQVKKSKEEQKKLLTSKDKAYEKYAAGNLTSDKYQLLVKETEQKVLVVSDRIEKLNDELNIVEDEYYQNVDDMKKIIRYAHIETLTKEVVDTFIKAIYVYKDKRIEIEWQFTDSFLNLTAHSG